MIYKIEDIKKDVRVVMDENAVNDALEGIGDIDTLTLDEIIGSKVTDAVDTVHMAAPYDMLEQGHNFGKEVYWGDLESGWVILPRDFMRLVIFEMSDWEQPVYGAISTADPLYARQRSRWKGIRGTSQNPVCAIAVRPEGRVLEFYSCKSEDAEVTRAVYIPYARVDLGGGVDISQRCYRAAVYEAAAEAHLSLGEADKASACKAMVRTLLGIEEENQQ
jgi:hypothetical protein